MAVFEKFTDEARQVVVYAQDEALLLGHNYIGTEHILLGLIREGDGVAARVLESLGLSLSAGREQVRKVIGQGVNAPSGHIPFTPRAGKLLAASGAEALALGNDRIGAGHILLALTRDPKSAGAQILAELGGDLNDVRQHVAELLAD